MKIRINNFDGGLVVTPEADAIPKNALFRARGVGRFNRVSAEVRPGSTGMVSSNAISLKYFDNNWFNHTSGGSLLIESDTIRGDLGANRLSFTQMPPTPGLQDRLYLCATTQTRKVDTHLSLRSDNFAWADSTGAANEYYLTDANGNDPGITQPAALLMNGVSKGTGTIGSLAAGKWNWGDNDTLGYNTVYVHTTGSTDPDNESTGYIEAVYCQEWGISPPPDGYLAVADGGAGGGLDDGGIYAYRLTYYNEHTGVRSNPTAPSTGTAPDEYTVLLCHCDGGDATTGSTDVGIYTHTLTHVGSCVASTTGSKFGTAKLLFPDTGDYLTAPNHNCFNFGTEPFTIDFWVQFATLPTTGQRMGLMELYQDASNYWLLYLINTGGQHYIQAPMVIDGSTVVVAISSGTFSSGTWYHIALVRGYLGDTSKWCIAIDGTFGAVGSWAGAFGDYTSVFYIGTGQGLTCLNTLGAMDEIRVSKGVARWTDDFTPSTAAYSTAYMDLTTGSTSMDLTNIPASTDTQVTHTEIWRTEGGGSSYYLVTRLSTTASATYTDDVPDTDLGSEELPTNNLKPYGWFDDCLGGYNASMFWITRTQNGERGRVYYSPVGRAEAVDGYINVSNDSEPLQRLVRFGTGLGVFSNGGFYEILGTNPYYAREIPGIPGTTKPHTVAETPYGIVYQSYDGVYILSGRSVRSLSADKVDTLFVGEARSNLAAFTTGTFATFARDEYIIADGVQTLAVNLRTGKWRDLGLVVTALSYAESVDELAATIAASKIIKLEHQGSTNDDGTSINYDVETAHIVLADDKKGLVRGVTLDYKTGNASENFTCTLVLDDSTTTLGTCASATRTQTYFPINKMGRKVGIRITGSLDYTAAVYDITLDVHIPQEERE